MLYEMMKECRNFFPIVEKVKTGTFAIQNGTIALLDFAQDQFYIIEGSVFNDGLHKVGDNSLKDETFEGYITPLAIPAEFLQLAAEVTEWQEKNGQASASLYESESFGGYSYKKAVGRSGGAVTWKDAFSARLSNWRKL